MHFDKVCFSFFFWFLVSGFLCVLLQALTPPTELQGIFGPGEAKSGIATAATSAIKKMKQFPYPYFLFFASFLSLFSLSHSSLNVLPHFLRLSDNFQMQCRRLLCQGNNAKSSSKGEREIGAGRLEDENGEAAAEVVEGIAKDCARMWMESEDDARRWCSISHKTCTCFSLCRNSTNMQSSIYIWHTIQSWELHFISFLHLFFLERAQIEKRAANKYIAKEKNLDKISKKEISTPAEIYDICRNKFVVIRQRFV